MEKFIKRECEQLKKDCIDYDDALNYIHEIVNDIMEERKLENEDRNAVEVLVLNQLKSTFNQS